MDGDLDLDEHGIFREKTGGSNTSGDQGILVDVDEDGIWRDDTDPISHYRQTDSGIGVDKKSSSATLNQVKSEFGSEEDYHQVVPLYREELYGDNIGQLYGDSTSQIDSKSTNSYHISELEASESVQGDVSLDQIIDSDQQLEFPELVDDSYLLSDQSNQRRSANENEEESVDLDRYIESYNGQRPFTLDPQYSDPQYSDDNKEDGYSSSGGEVSDLGEEYDDFNQVMTRPSDKTTKDDSRPPITGDSIFTQEEFSSHKQSLHEFEKLEAALGDSGSENGDNLDLIGAYLRGLKDQEEDDQLNDSEVARHHPGNRRKSPLSKIPVRSPSLSRNRSPSKSPSRQTNATPTRIPRYRSPSRNGAPSPSRSTSRNGAPSPSRSTSRTGAPSPTSRRGINNSPSRLPIRSGKSPVRALHSPQYRRTSFSPRSPRVFDTNGYQRTRDTISMISGSVDEIMLEPEENSDDDREMGGMTEPREGEPDTARSVASNQLEGSLIGDQNFPYVDDPQSSLHFREDKDESHHSPNRTKIPMLRSRSPSMSRPGSSLSRSNSRGAGSRPSSPARKLGPNQTGIPAPVQSTSKGSRRSLPLTPQKRPFRDEEDITPRSLHVESVLSQPESELGRATNLLMMDADDIEKEANDKVTGLPLTSVTKHKMELRLSQDEHSGGEDLSQGSNSSKRELKTRYVEEITHRKRHEDTINQLSIEYSNLLKKYAQAENTIDELRLGAKVKLYSDSPTPGQAQQGSIVTVYQPGQTPGSGVSQGSSGGGARTQHAVLSTLSVQHTGEGHASQTSQNSSAGSSVHPSLSRDELDSLAGEGVKLSLLAKAKAIEEQVNAFQILLTENHLNLDDQSKALENIKSNYDYLQTTYNTAKEEHEYIRRQGALSEAALDPGFDENQEVAGELYRLNMKLDQIEHDVQENTKKNAIRKPFSGKPVKGDHSLVSTDNVNHTLPTMPSDRTASTGSMTGAAAVDEKLHKLSKEYSSLMDRYRRLKGFKPSVKTEQEIEEVLDKVKAVYKQTPDHRKPALPAELEQLYDTATGQFLTPQEVNENNVDAVSPRSLSTENRKLSDDHVTNHKKPPFSPRRARLSSVDSALSTEYTDKTPKMERYRRSVGDYRGGTERGNPLGTNRRGNPSGTNRQGYLGDNPPTTQGSPGSDSDVIVRGREYRRLPRPGPGSRRKDPRGSWRKDTAGNEPWNKEGDGSWSGRKDKDSGYMGSESSRKGGVSRGLPKRGVSGIATGTSRSHDRDEDSDLSSSDTGDSVIERKLMSSHGNTKQNGGDAIVNREDETTNDNRKTQSRSRSRSKGRGVKAESWSSLTSEDKVSPRSEKIKSLTDEVEKLKATLNPGQVIIQGQTPHQILSGVQATVPPTMQHQAPVQQPLQPNQAVNYTNPVMSQPYIQSNAALPYTYPTNEQYYAPTDPRTQYPPTDPGTQYPPTDPRAQYPPTNRYTSLDQPAHYQDNTAPYNYFDYPGEDKENYYDHGEYYEPTYYRSHDPHDVYDDSHGRPDNQYIDRYSRVERYPEKRYYDDYESRDQDFDDIKGRDYDSVDGELYDRDSRSRSSRDRQRTRSPDKYADMRHKYLPRSGRSHSGSRPRRDHSGQRLYHRDHSGSPITSYERRNLSPSRRYGNQVRIGGRPPPYPAGQRTAQYNNVYPTNGQNGPQNGPGYITGGLQQTPGGAQQSTYPHTLGVTPLQQSAYPHTPGVTPVQQSAYPHTPGVTPGVTPGQTYNQPSSYLQPVGTMYNTSGSVKPVSSGSQLTSCPMCGGQGHHSHANYVFQPGNATATTSNSSGLVPVQLVPAASSAASGKVRYYVREYGGDSDVTGRTGHILKKQTYIDDSDNDEEDLNDSLHKAMKTAKKLKKMSFRMKQTLHDEINKSIQEGSFLMT